MASVPRGFTRGHGDHPSRDVFAGDQLTIELHRPSEALTNTRQTPRFSSTLKPDPTRHDDRGGGAPTPVIVPRLRRVQPWPRDDRRLPAGREPYCDLQRQGCGEASGECELCRYVRVRRWRLAIDLSICSAGAGWPRFMRRTMARSAGGSLSRSFVVKPSCNPFRARGAASNSPHGASAETRHDEHGPCHEEPTE